MKIQELEVKEVKINPAIATRKGDPDESAVNQIALSYQQRHEDGLEPVQINPGLVRIVDGKYELIDGRNRLDAVKLVNAAGGLSGEPMLFSAQVVRAGDEQGIITGIQANFHSATTVFDRADAMQKLVDLGKSQKDIANIFNMSEGTVSQMLKLQKLEKKYVKAVEEGDIEQDAAIFLADLDASDSQRQAIFEECIRHRQKFDEIMTKVESKQDEARVKAEIEAAKAKADELAAKAKEAEKAKKEAEKVMAKTKDTKELEKVRKEAEKAKETLKSTEKELKQAVKALDKAKSTKAKMVEAKKKSKATVEDVKEAAKAKGVTKSKGKTITPSPRTKSQLVVCMEAMCQDKENPASEPMKALIGRIEEYLLGEITDQQLENSFRRNCK